MLGIEPHFLPLAAYACIAALLCFLLPYHIQRRKLASQTERRLSFGASEAPIESGLSVIKDGVRAMKDHRLLELSSNRFGAIGSNTVHVKFPGGHFYETADPENVKTMLSSDFRKWGLAKARKDTFRPVMGEGIFIAEGAKWKHSRALLRPMFSRTQLENFAIFEDQATHLVNAIARADGKVDLRDLFFRMTLDTSLEFLMGESISSLANPEDAKRSAMNSALHRVEVHISSGGGLGNACTSWLPKSRQYVKDIQTIRSFVESFILPRLAKREEILHRDDEGPSDGERPTFLDELVKQTSDLTEIGDEILSTLFAGRDTTASLLTNIFFVVSRRQEIWKALQDEINHALPDGQRPSSDQLKQLKYLRALVNESLRLHPVIPGNTRQALEDTVLPSGGGPDGTAPVFIPKGEMVRFNTFAMQRRTDLYGEDALEFRPERWLDTDSSRGLRVRWEYIPFGGGPRICLGQMFALNHAMYTIVRMCQEFSEIESWGEEEVWREDITMGVCTNFSGAKVMLRK
ncbi:hypothetical protein CKM354_000137300 [Cercospora kikuchii]|uniref:Uncharacterized protein n=1 Tax=Cercospora kikuchii TaxID=84275 RepID=A0A9P3CDC6_9PEZI|nr:uncharacterized protein CKM354_000137300 [Cercospora kikuchii]GIZ37945.1 hypothetical protein CKM354_000137300 [Cercospora kikuchii]